MSYFKELPNIKYTANFPNQSYNTDTVDVKNIFRRARLREDIANAVTAFNYYQIQDKERPDTLAKKFYNDETLDWVILITNNITDVNEQWPLDNNSLYDYMIDKYGSEETLGQLNYYTSLETREEYNRLLIPKDLNVDTSIVHPDPITTTANTSQYTLTSYPILSDTTVSVNLNQIVPAYQRSTAVVNHLVNDIHISARNIGTSYSNMYIKKRNASLTPITIHNTLSSWPSSWGGTLSVSTRSNTDVVVSVGDTVGPTNITIPSFLFQVITVNDVPTFTFNTFQ